MKKQKRMKNATKLPRSIKRLFPNVTQAYDSTDYAQVLVEKKDCRDGKKKDPNECAMARAIKREYKADGAIIGMSYSYLIKGNKAIRFKTPPSVRTEIVSFDRHHDFQPGEYILTPPGKNERLGSIHKSGPSGTYKTKRSYHKTANVRVLQSGSSY